MENSVAPELRTVVHMHNFTSADGTEYSWEEKVESALSLEEVEIQALREIICNLSDKALQNSTSGNGIPMGVPIPLSEEHLAAFLNLILSVIAMKDKFTIKLTNHASDRLTEDMLNGPGHPDFRGWLSERDVENCILTISQVGGARLTINRNTMKQSPIKFNSDIALEVRGTKTSGEEGTIALAIVESNKIRIITLL